MAIGPEETIYRSETGLDTAFEIKIDPADMTFVKLLKASEASSIFQVDYRGKPRVLKVFHNNGDPGYASDRVRDLNRSPSEIRAYCRLKRFGICDGGYVPNFYGFMLEVDPANFAPHLSAFQHDSGHPSAILIEYLPNSTPMNCVTYSKERMDKAIKGIEQIHSAFIEHNDSYTKNTLIVPGSERVLWIDFDVAITYPNSTFIGERERCWIKEETECVKGFGVKLADDQKKGLQPNTKYY
ncbi:hypothetical protein CIHG_02349 [Coccidioides immitis H538.4]|uniref:Protein kinase domain-containing protein n=1 Tax=Coccidioides immitis H538.4 TaxID=396776 RepID=A0A0J8RHE2_COCIT|nr:hypothetical protein CIHG_02349 [Coccidioides immitis H538.4]TPX26572.1 hypothetical protein DIZ76_012034 [Coccidioides immitis]